MSSSKYLNGLSSEEYENLKKKLYEQQNGKCFICCKDIDMRIQNTNIDHVIPLVNNGKDAEINFALTHEICNKEKQDADLNIARILSKLKDIRESVANNKQATLGDVLSAFDGAKYGFSYTIENDMLNYSFDKKDTAIYHSAIFKDNLSGEETAFIEVPIEYVFHDTLINPRGINNSIGLLIKEFYKKNPQLHLCLARIDDGKIKIFDGQHKAVAQILLGTRKIPLRLFINPDVERLIETNTNAGSKLKQIAFDKSIIRQLHSTLLSEKIAEYQRSHGLAEDDMRFSEQDLVEYFKGDRGNVKNYIINSQKNYVTYNSKLTDYIDFEGRNKEKPISYSAFEKTFLSLFINSKIVLSTPLSDKDDENPRVLEANQLIKLCNILAENIYINKYNVEIGTYRIEEKIIKKKDKDISDSHLIAYRVSKEEILANWLRIIVSIIKSYFYNTGCNFNEDSLFQQEIPEQLWTNITNFVKNFIELPLWKDRNLSSTIFAGKSNYDFWNHIFSTGKAPDNTQVLSDRINYLEMLK